MKLPPLLKNIKTALIKRKSLQELENLIPELTDDGRHWNRLYAEIIPRKEKALLKAENLLARYPDTPASFYLENGWEAKGLLPIERYRSRVLPRLRDYAEREKDPLAIALAGAETLENKPRRAALFLQAARIYLQNGLTEKALEAARRAEKAHNPPGKSVLGFLARLYHIQGKKAQARTLLETELEPSLIKIKVLCRLNTPEYRQMAIDQIALIENRSEYEKAFLHLSEALLTEGRSTEVETLLKTGEIPAALRDRLWHALAHRYREEAREDQAAYAAQEISSPRLQEMFRLSGLTPEEWEAGMTGLPDEPEYFLSLLPIMPETLRSAAAEGILERVLLQLRKRYAEKPRDSREGALWRKLIEAVHEYGSEALLPRVLAEAVTASRGKLAFAAELPVDQLSPAFREQFSQHCRNLPPEKTGSYLLRKIIPSLLAMEQYAVLFGVIRKLAHQRERIEALLRTGGLLLERGGKKYPPVWDAAGAMELHKLFLEMEV